ncbi:hypothetical protein HYH03_008235 [Edaphochlamys debaryana]|uniref:START domain-containing protein n=1 Tax=Edaphochlamys debaryana TaxID=47281 RepID=A0A836BZ95_9CHLO|nr:hypothetical protein HYH03_008235 [Edaphochlamys debaryana]|eukprot:KAG2493722.1 hypothetical protein HYH03_008235 [Edaphochlamys debaryana]
MAQPKKRRGLLGLGCLSCFSVPEESSPASPTASAAVVAVAEPATPGPIVAQEPTPEAPAPTATRATADAAANPLPNGAHGGSPAHLDCSPRSASSACSSMYHSAGGWSQVSWQEDGGEWLGFDTALAAATRAHSAGAPVLRTGAPPGTRPSGRGGTSTSPGSPVLSRAGDHRTGVEDSQLGLAHPLHPNHHHHHPHHHPHAQPDHHHHQDQASPTQAPADANPAPADEGAGAAVAAEQQPAAGPLPNGNGNGNPGVPNGHAATATIFATAGSAATAAAAAVTATAEAAGAGSGVAGVAPRSESEAELEAVLSRVAHLYGEAGQPCKACRTLLSFCKKREVKPESMAPHLRARQLPDAGKLAQVVQGVADGLSDITSDEGWQTVRDDDLRLQYKHPTPTVHAFRARAVLEAPSEYMVALCRELDLVPTWNKYCTTADVLRVDSLTDVTAYMSIWMPWPLNNVGFCLSANGAEMFEEEGALVITFTSIDPRKDPSLELPPGVEKDRRLRVLRPSAIKFMPLPPKTPDGPGRTLCYMQAYIDPGIRNLPGFVISFVLKVLSPFVYTAVQKTLAAAFKSPGLPLPSRIAQRPELYDWVARRTREYIAAKQAAGETLHDPTPARAGRKAAAARA